MRRFNLFEFLNNNPDFSSFLQNLCEQNNCYKVTSNAIITRCPICGDSIKHPVNHGHLYLYENGYAICFRCNWRGSINKAIIEISRKLRVPYPTELRDKLEIATNRFKYRLAKSVQKQLKELSADNSEFNRQYKLFLQSLLANVPNCYEYYNTACSELADTMLVQYDRAYEVYSEAEMLNLPEAQYVLQRMQQPESYKLAIKEVYENPINLLYSSGFIPTTYLQELFNSLQMKKYFDTDQILNRLNWAKGDKACFLSQTGLLIQCRAITDNISAAPKYMTIHLIKYHRQLKQYWSSFNSVSIYLRHKLAEDSNALNCLLQKYIAFVPTYELWLTLFGRKYNYRGLVLAEGIFDLLNPFALQLVVRGKLYPIAVLGKSNYFKLLSTIAVNNRLEEIVILSDADIPEQFWQQIVNKLNTIRSLTVYYNTVGKDFNAAEVKPILKTFRRFEKWHKHTA